MPKRIMVKSKMDLLGNKVVAAYRERTMTYHLSNIQIVQSSVGPNLAVLIFCFICTYIFYVLLFSPLRKG